jgi:hypothetical protein
VILAGRAYVALLSIVLIAGCSNDGQPNGSSSSTESGMSAPKVLNLGDAGACSLLNNAEVAEVVGSEVVGSSPSPGGDDACTFAYGDSTMVAPPDGPHLVVVVRRDATVSDVAPIANLGLDGTWNAKSTSLAVQFDDATVTIDLPEDGTRADAEALAEALVARVRTPPPLTATTVTSVPRAGDGFTTTTAS